MSSLGIRLRIKGCSIPNAWYKDKIGSVFEFMGNDESFYYIKDDSGFQNKIPKVDGELIKDEYGSFI